jgi:hypothetical protein
MKCLGYKTPLGFLPNAAVLHLPVESRGGRYENDIFYKEKGKWVLYLML